LIASLTGLTEGRFPVPAPIGLIKRTDRPRGLEIFARRHARVVAVNDGVITKVGMSASLGRHLVLRDVYGNRYTYAHLGSVEKRYRTSTRRVTVPKQPHSAQAPKGPASAGRQPAKSSTAELSAPAKERVIAHPQQSYRRAARDAEAKGMHLRPLKPGSRVVQGTTIAHMPDTRAHLHLSIRPAGRGAPRIDPKPIVDGWRLLAAAATRGAERRTSPFSRSIGQVFLMSKPMLERRVLSDRRIAIYACGRQDIRAGQVDRRVLATLAFLGDSGLNPTVTSLRCGHGLYTASGNVSEHSSGNAVDIAEINGVPILGHQEPGGITEQTVRQLMRLQGTLRPHQLISLLELGGPTFAMADHDDHIHVGFQPLFGENRKLGAQALAVLEPGQWSDLLARLREIDNPVVPTKPSKYSLPARRAGRRASDAHKGE
jgi:hypothetical protein